MNSSAVTRRDSLDASVVSLGSRSNPHGAWTTACKAKTARARAARRPPSDARSRPRQGPSSPTPAGRGRRGACSTPRRARSPASASATVVLPTPPFGSRSRRSPRRLLSRHACMRTCTKEEAGRRRSGPRAQASASLSSASSLSPASLAAVPAVVRRQGTSPVSAAVSSGQMRRTLSLRPASSAPPVSRNARTRGRGFSLPSR